MQRNKNFKQKGFTLIELLVVVAIIGLLSSVILIAVQSARAKARNTKRLGDMTQVNTALELYNNSNRGYPPSSNGSPVGLSPTYLGLLPTAPTPADGVCDGVSHSAVVTADNGGIPVPANTFYYIATGTPSGGNYPTYSYYFCLGDKTGNYSQGERILTPTGVQ